jgi:predicted ThiF/HesA family dinucleotide-utilizing enzyme
MNEHLKRLRGRVDRRRIAPATIAVIGVGRVGGHVALELARLVPRRLILVDGDDFEATNLGGHPLPAEFLAWNKAVAMAAHLEREFPGVKNITAVPHYIDAEIPDEQLLADVIEPATVLIAATDTLAVQRRVSLLARAAAVPMVVPGIAEDGSRGEAFLSLSEAEPCLTCFDGYRPAGSSVRGAAVVNPDAFPAIHLAFSLALAVLDSDSREAERLLTPRRTGGPVPQLFRAWPPGADELSRPDPGHTEVSWRENCPGCGGVPSPRGATRRALPERNGERPAVPLDGGALLLVAFALVLLFAVIVVVATGLAVLIDVLIG